MSNVFAPTIPIGDPDAGATFRHRQRGTSYTVVGKAVLQTGTALTDDQQVIVYVGADGQLWVRSVEEFCDGRFEKIDKS
jgi:hypothetical protein